MRLKICLLLLLELSLEFFAEFRVEVQKFEILHLFETLLLLLKGEVDECVVESAGERGDLVVDQVVGPVTEVERLEEVKHNPGQHEALA